MMKKVEFPWESVKGDWQVQSQWIVEVMKSFSRKQFINDYTVHAGRIPGTFSIDIWYIFLGILFSLFYENIQQMKLKKGDEEYDKMVKTIGLLASITNCDWELTTDEVEQFIEQDILPINTIAYYADVLDKDNVHDGSFKGVKRSRFHDVMDLIGGVFAEYESEYPTFKDHPEWYRDGDLNLLQLAINDINKTYHMRKMFLEQQQKTLKQPAGNHLDFDL